MAFHILFRSPSTHTRTFLCGTTKSELQTSWPLLKSFQHIFPRNKNRPPIMTPLKHPRNLTLILSNILSVFKFPNNGLYSFVLFSLNPGPNQEAGISPYHSLVFFSLEGFQPFLGHWYFEASGKLSCRMPYRLGIRLNIFGKNVVPPTTSHPGYIIGPL